MAGRGATTFQKRQKEQSRKEKREEKLARRLQRKEGGPETAELRPSDLLGEETDASLDSPRALEILRALENPPAKNDDSAA
ncbi:MAG TPA: hypothetical protein VMZ52_06635 [Bryobacteraceae bacterium]|nr:hypothetical protein [Bryobacteraceae bacterium]